MIRTAIIELNEEAGSSEESISGFIEKEYEGLPCGHVAFLSHHLRRLCESGEIVRKNDGRCMIGVDSGDIEDEKEMGERTNIRQMEDQLVSIPNASETCLTEQKLEEDCQAERQELEIIDDYSKVKEKQIVVFEEQQQHAVEKCEVEEQSETLREGIEATEQQIEVLYRTEGPSVELNDEEKNCPQNQLHEVIEETNHWKKLQIEVCEEYTSVHGQQNRVIEEKNMFQEQQTQLLYLTQGPSEELNDEEQNCPQNQQHEVIEELNGMQKLHLEVCEEYMSVSRQQNRVIEEKNMLQEQQTEVRNDRAEDQLVNIPSASETIGRCLDCNGSSYSLKESCMELVTKKTEFLDRLMGNLNSFGGMEQQEQLTESPCTERASNVEVIKEQKQLQEREHRLIRGESRSLEHQNQVETKLLSLYCLNGEGVSENSLVGESPLPAVKEYLKESLNQVHLQQQAKTIQGDWKHIVVCGLKAQQLTETCDKPKTPKSQLVKKQQQLPWSQTTRSRRHKLDADTTRNALPPSYHQHDINQLGADTTANAILFSDHHHGIAQKQDHPPEGQLRPSKAEGNGGQQKAPESHLDNERRSHRSRSRARTRCRPKLDADATMSFILALPSDQQQRSEQKLRHQPEGQLRPSKAEGNGDQQKAPESHRDNEHPHRSRSRARTPCRPKLDADATMSVILPLPSDQQQNIEQKLQHQPEGQGRPSNAEGNKDHHRSLRFYVRRKHRQ